MIDHYNDNDADADDADAVLKETRPLYDGGATPPRIKVR